MEVSEYLLAEISTCYDGWFTEGFDTADLKEAKALLDELNGLNRWLNETKTP